MSTRRLCLNLTLSAEEGRTLRKQSFRTADGGYLELWLDSEQRVHEFSLSPAGTEAPAPEPPAANREDQFELSNLLRMPRTFAGSPGGSPRFWRGLLLLCPLALETVPALKSVSVEGWCPEAGAPVLQLLATEPSLRAEFYVRRVSAWKGRKFVLLELPDGLLPPDEERTLVLVEVLDRGILRTLPHGDFLRCLAGMEALPGNTPLLERMGELFGPQRTHLPAERPWSGLYQETERHYGTRWCPECRASLRPGSLYCVECGARSPAPPCPACRRPVVPPAADRPWHIGWRGRCGQCGHLVAASRRVGAIIPPPTGTGQTPPEPVDAVDRPGRVESESLLQVSGAESVRVEGERREYQPLVRIRVNRLLSGEEVGMAGALPAEEQLSLTVAECRALLAELQGPLAILMERESWIHTAQDARE